MHKCSAIAMPLLVSLTTVRNLDEKAKRDMRRTDTNTLALEYAVARKNYTKLIVRLARDVRERAVAAFVVEGDGA
jgi:hypothetical protein